MTITAASPEARPHADTAPHLAALVAGAPVDRAGIAALFEALVAGHLAEAEIAAMLVALKLKGETAEDLVGAATALRAAATPFDRPDYLFADCCGTGGDGSGTINVSTAAAFVSAAAGLPVAKHGNRSVTSRCGSADVLEQLGVKIDTSPAASRRALDEAGICFLFAPQYHPGLRHAGPVRRTLKVRTIMNMLGPLVNPAGASVQIVGVAAPELVEPIAHTLAALGSTRAMIVHGSGLDEIALHGETLVADLKDGAVTTRTIDPSTAGIAPAPLSALAGGDPEENAGRLAALLKGEGTPVETAAVALNAGALLATAGLADDLKAGADLATRTIASGEPYRRLQLLAEISHG